MMLAKPLQALQRKDEKRSSYPRSKVESSVLERAKVLSSSSSNIYKSEKATKSVFETRRISFWNCL